MCGLVGIIGPSNNKETRDMFKYMLFFDTLRGWDSTGVFTVSDKTDSVSIFKKAMPAPDFIHMPQMKDMLTYRATYSPTYSAMIGHNRAATVGVVNSVNAHPFEHGDITLVHNGTLRNEKELKSYMDHDVDSEMLCDDFSREGWKSTIEMTQGAYALIWNDSSDNTINVLRNSERTLYLAVCYRAGYQANSIIGKPFIALASEAWMIEAAAAKAGITIEGNPEKIPTLTKFTFDLDDMTRSDLDLENILDNVKTEKFEEAVSPMGKGGASRGTTAGISTTYTPRSNTKERYRFQPDVAKKSSQSGMWTAYGTMPSSAKIRCFVTEEISEKINSGKILSISANKIGSYRVMGETTDTTLLDATKDRTIVYNDSKDQEVKK